MLLMVLAQRRLGEDGEMRLFCTECEDEFTWDEMMEHAEKVHFTTTVMLTGSIDPERQHAIQLADE
jgi:hypothetical protein